MSGPRSSRGFTLVELLVVIAIIGILIALLLPAVQAARESARRSACRNNLKQVALAIHHYHDTYNAFPAGNVVNFEPDGNGCYIGAGTQLPGPPWTVLVLPYLEQSSMFESLNLGPDPAGGFNTNLVAFNSYSNIGVQTNNTALCRIPLGVFRCPSYALPPHEWVFPATVVQPFDPVYAQVVNNYYGCMGGGPVVTATPTITTDACYRSGVPGAAVTMFKNGLIGVNARDQVSGKIKYTRSFKDCLDGASNVVLAGESSYQGIETLRGWFNGYRSNAGGANGNNPPGNICGTAGKINGGRAHYLANTNRTSNQNIHNAINTIYFGSEHRGGCHLAYADGSAHFFSENISLPLYQRLGDMKDGWPPGGFTP